MKIAVIIERFTPESGGAERSTSELVAEMQSRGHQITLLTGKGPRGPLPAGCAIRLCPLGQPKGMFRLLYFRHWVRSQLAAGEFDASLSVAGTIPAAAVEPRAGLIPDIQSRSLAWRKPGLSRLLKRVFLTLNLRQHLLRKLERKTFHDPTVRHIVCISRMIEGRCGELYPAAAAKRLHNPNAVKPVSATAEEMAGFRQKIRREWNVADAQTVFLFPALDSRRKGLTPLLHAFALLRREHPKVGAILVLAGRVHASQKPLIDQLGLTECVRNVGMIPDPRPLYAAADVTVVPTYYDTFARVSIESLLLGRPALTSAFDGAAELVAPMPDPSTHRGRVIANPDDHAALAQAMFELCDPAERARCMTALGASVISEYTTARHVDRLLELLAGK